MATKGYKIDFENNTLVMNHKFYAASQEYGTEQNKLVKEIMNDFPSLTVVVKSGRETKTPNKNKRPQNPRSDTAAAAPWSCRSASISSVLESFGWLSGCLA